MSGWSDWTYQVYLYFSKVLGSPTPGQKFHRQYLKNAHAEKTGTCRYVEATELLSRIISSCYEPRCFPLVNYIRALM